MQPGLFVFDGNSREIVRNDWEMIGDFCRG
jgi:hypothetical protein